MEHLALRQPPARVVVGTSIAVLALAGGLLGMIAVQPMLVDEYRWPALWAGLTAVAVSTTVLLGLGLAFGIARPTAVRGRTVVTCMFLGWLNCPVALVLAEYLEGTPPTDAAWVLVGLLFGAATGAPLGLVYGLVAMIPMQRLRALLDDPTLADQYEALRTVGFTLLGPALLAVFIVEETAFGVIPHAVPLSLVAFALGLIGVGWWMRRRLMDERYLATHERVPLDDLGMRPADLIPLHRGVSPSARHALVARLAERGDGGYRSQRARVPIALVD